MRLREYFANLQYRYQMARFRESMAFFGCPVDHLSDADVEASLQEAARYLAKVGITMQQAAEAGAQLRDTLLQTSAETDA